MRPKSIIRFDQAYLSAVVVGLLNTALTFEKTTAELAREPSSAQIGLGTGFLLAMLGFSFGMTLLLWFLVSRRASNVAKWILVVLTTAGMLMAMTSLANWAALSESELALMLLGAALELVALYFLFQRDAREWFASKGRVGTVDPAVFD